MADKTHVSWLRREAERRLQAQMALGRQEFAERLRRLRETHDPPMTQEKAAAFLDVPARSYVRWENEEVDASLASRERIARGYGIDPQELIRETDDTDPRATAEDLHRLETKIDRILAILEAPIAELAPTLDATGETGLQNAAAMLGPLLLAGAQAIRQAQEQAQQDTAAPDQKPATAAAGRG